MRSKPAKFILLITAILGLSLSAIAACACTHHQPQIKSGSVSCHGTMHEDAQTAQAEAVPTGKSVGVRCECSIPTAAPAIFVKNESKRLYAGQADPTVKTASVPLLELAAFVPCEEATLSFSDPKFYRLTFARSGPSRAPPRL